MDGRHPSEKDYELCSKMIGADSISINSNSEIWDERGFNTSAGVLVMVGVRTPNKDDKFVLLLTSRATEPSGI